MSMTSYLVSPLLGGRLHQDDYCRVGSASGPAVASSWNSNNPERQTDVDANPRLLLSLVSLPRERTVSSIAHDSAPFRALAAIAMSLRHPYVSRIVGMHAVSPTGQSHIHPTVAIVRPLCDVGSLRDFLYHQPLHEFQ